MSQPLLEGHQEYMEDRGPDVIAQLNQRIEELEARISGVESDRPAIQRGAVIIVLKLLTEALRQVASGKMDVPDVSHVAATNGQDARWNAIKQRLAPRISQAIDVLLLHGTMNTSQLAAAMKMDRSNCGTNVVTKLKSMGLIVKNGNDFQLKELP